MNSLVIARRYATALADVATAGNEARAVQEELTAWERIMQSNAKLAEINRQLAQVLDERAGMVAAIVTTARPVPQTSQQELNAKLAALTGKKVRVGFETDDELIGGIVTRIGSTVYDGSVRNQLQQIKERMAG